MKEENIYSGMHVRLTGSVTVYTVVTTPSDDNGLFIIEADSIRHWVTADLVESCEQNSVRRTVPADNTESGALAAEGEHSAEDECPLTAVGNTAIKKDHTAAYLVVAAEFKSRHKKKKAWWFTLSNGTEVSEQTLTENYEIIK